MPQKFSDIIDEEFSKLSILNYFPYGSTTNYRNFVGGINNLKDLHLSDRNKGKTANDYIIAIFKESGSAMHYLTIYREHNLKDTQTIRAFCMWELFNNGFVGWNKEITKGKSEDEIVKIDKLHRKRYSMLRFGYVGGKDPQQPNTKEYKEAARKCAIANRKDHGIYEVKHYPLVSHVRTPLYTKQELAAILFMVNDEFENLC